MEFIRNYGIALVAFFLVDILWLGFVAKNLYAKYIGHLMAKKTNWPGAIIFYLLYVVALLFLVVYPALEKGDLRFALMGGGIFGLLTYGTYNLTNLATLKDWPAIISMIDMIWGTLLNVMTAGLSFYFINLFS